MKKLLGGLFGISLVLCIALRPAVAQTPPNTLILNSQFAEIERGKLVGPTTGTNVVCLWVDGVYSNRPFPPQESHEKDLIRETKRIAQAILKNFNVRNSSYRSLSRCKNGLKKSI